MDGRKKKLSMSPVAQAFMRHFLAEDGYEIRKIGESKYQGSEKKRWNQTINRIIKIFHFTKKQKEILKALSSKSPLEINQIVAMVGTTNNEAARALINETRKRIKSTQYLKDVMDIGIFGQGRKRFYTLNFFDPASKTSSHER